MNAERVRRYGKLTFKVHIGTSSVFFNASFRLLERLGVCGRRARTSAFTFFARPQEAISFNSCSASRIAMLERLPTSVAVIRRDSLKTSTRRTRARAGLFIRRESRSGVAIQIFF